MNTKTIILAVTGGIAAYKAATVASRLTQAGATVYVLMTEAATKFITPLTFQALTRQPVYTDTFAEHHPQVISHIDLADRADLFLVVPATANIIGKMAHGTADDMVTTTWLATTAPTILAPAMNGHMLEHPIVAANLTRLKELGVMTIEPNEGQLACGYVGKGRLAEPEHIVTIVEQFFTMQSLLAGQKWMITAGGTREAIDPVRYLGNRSSGKMGHAIALAAAQAGALVELITTSPNSIPHPNIKINVVESAAQMYDAVMTHAEDMDVIVKSAAVADYRPITVADQKMKKHDDLLVLQLIKNRDILAELGARSLRATLIGFAAETEHVEQFARAKMANKQCDWMVANNVLQEGAGFAQDTNIVTIYGPDGYVEQLPKMSKLQLARHLIQLVQSRKGTT